MTAAARIQVAVPVAQIRHTLTYAVPQALRDQARPGVRVQVPVGGRRMVGVITDEPPAPAPPTGLRLIEAVLDETPVVTEAQLALCRFLADYYLAPLGECLRLVLPPQTARDVKRTYRITEAGRAASVFAAAVGLKEQERRLLASFADGEHRTSAALRRAGLSPRRLEALIAGGFLSVVSHGGAPQARRTERAVSLEGGAPLPARAPALAALDAWLREQPAPPSLEEARVLFSDLRGKLRRLEALGRVRIDSEARALHVSSALSASAAPRELTSAQAEAVARILAGEGGRAFLLEGVTGSGKTEVYLRVLEAVLSRGQGALLIVPEIALTPQLLARVIDKVGAEVAVLHSGLSPAERRDALARLKAGQARVALGARSALFAPMPALGLIIVDEEHDSSLKQDEAPRYHGRDVALFRARAEGAVCVLGSATPSLESRHNAALGKLEHLVLPRRIGGGGELPEVTIVDLRERKRVNEARARDKAVSEGAPGAILSGPLIEAMEETLAAGEQALLFLNRRGYAAFLLCEACGEIRHCPDCSVSLTLHKGQGRLVCHQCDHTEPIPETCPACGYGPVLALGLGTERVEAEVRARFPQARLARLDRDTMREKGALARTLSAVQRREVDVLIGTQMVAKGHDFPGIALVGVILADVALAVPDFRAAERAFSLLTQVAGRAGRGGARGRVLLQTYNPEHPAIALAARHDVAAFAALELEEREAARCPPFWRAAVVRVEGEDATAVDALARRAGDVLRACGRARLESGAWDVLGPAPAPIERLKGRVRHHLFVRTQSVRPRAQLLSALQSDEALCKALERAQCRLIVDVDPAHLL